MVHRDIKPGNLMLSRTRGPGDDQGTRLRPVQGGQRAGDELDHHRHGSLQRELSGERLTLAGQMLGTPDFIAPEQIVDAQRADIRADIYSLGCTLYYLLERPSAVSRRQASADVLKAHCSMDATPLDLVRPDVPAELSTLVARMMARDPADRFQTPAEVAKALTPFFKKQSMAHGGPGLGASSATIPAPAAGRPKLRPQPAPVRGQI